MRSGRACLGSDVCQLLMVLVVPFAGIVSMAHLSPCMAWHGIRLQSTTPFNRCLCDSIQIRPRLEQRFCWYLIPWRDVTCDSESHD